MKELKSKRNKENKDEHLESEHQNQNQSMVQEAHLSKPPNSLSQSLSYVKA